MTHAIDEFDADREMPDHEADLAFVRMLLGGIEPVEARIRWVRRWLSGTAHLMGVDWDLVRGEE